MHDLLYLIALKQGKYDVELSNLNSIQESTTRQHSRRELQINKNRLVRSDENFFHRTKIQYPDERTSKPNLLLLLLKACMYLCGH